VSTGDTGTRLAGRGVPGTARVVVVTGASRGIGSHLADAFARAGYDVERGSRQVAEVTDRTQVERWVGDVVGRHGRVDVLVNNAGVVDAEVALEESDPEDWWRTVEVNVLGPYLVTRAVLPHMLAAGTGRVINLNSGAGTRAGELGSAYNVSKTALGRLTGSIHLSGRARGVRAFDLAPGVVRTDMTTSMEAHQDRTDWTDPADVVDLALALASGDLDDWSGRMVRAGADTPASLRDRARTGLTPEARTVGLIPWGPDDPLA
jgi:NAD(P)-dependent dehydrogenase (short-subunit alcohol dehydrogenase family)